MCKVGGSWFLAFGCFYWGLRLSCFISSSCATDVIHSRTVFHSSSRETSILFSLIITNCFSNCYTGFPWLQVSSISDFKFYCNRILRYFENDLRWNEASGYFIDNQNIWASINAFKHIEKKHGQFIFRNVRSLEHVKKKYSKVIIKTSTLSKLAEERI